MASSQVKEGDEVHFNQQSNEEVGKKEDAKPLKAIAAAKAAAAVQQLLIDDVDGEVEGFGEDDREEEDLDDEITQYEIKNSFHYVQTARL
jgi:hypothetical protein